MKRNKGEKATHHWSRCRIGHCWSRLCDRGDLGGRLAGRWRSKCGERPDRNLDNEQQGIKSIASISLIAALHTLAD